MRVFIHVNTNRGHAYLTIHCEHNAPCSHILQQVLNNNAAVNVSIEDISEQLGLRPRRALRMFGTENSFWICLWVSEDELNQIFNNPESNEIIQRIAQHFGVGIQLCQHCCANN
jgi:AraC-like DNA-binding protein